MAEHLHRENEEKSGAASTIPSTMAVLAGGLGTRLRRVVVDRPKVLAPVAGRPFLDYVLAYLTWQGLREVILCVGHLAEQVQRFAGDGRRWGLQVRYSIEQAPLGTGGALHQVSQALSRPFFAMNGDTLFLADLQALWKTHLARQAAATLALLPVQDWQSRGSVTLAEDGTITAFDEKPDQGWLADPAPVLVNGGIYVINPGALAFIQPGRAISIEREVFPILADQGRLAGLVQAAYFADIGTPESLAAFEQDLIAGAISFDKDSIKSKLQD